MKIGEFAKECKTKRSVLRHYDKLGLLRPVYIDRFTEYRYYDESQIEVFEMIRELKRADFSLADIKLMLSSDEERERLFEEKRNSLEKKLKTLELLRQTMFGGNYMNNGHQPFVENTDLPFVNDEDAVGKWQVLSVNGDSGGEMLIGSRERFLYFLPGGERYWCYGWTKGKLIFDNGEDRYCNDYRIEKRKDGLYMTIDFKSVYYPENGEITRVELRRIDGEHYTKRGIARKDNVDMPFVDDPEVIGKWKACCYIDGEERRKEDLTPEMLPPVSENYKDLYCSEVEFFEGGGFSSVYGGVKISGDDNQTWTKGYVLRKFNDCACAYEIKVIGGRKYLIMEWKSGDYRWGGLDTDHYVFTKE